MHTPLPPLARYGRPPIWYAAEAFRLAVSIGFVAAVALVTGFWS